MAPLLSTGDLLACLVEKVEPLDRKLTMPLSARTSSSMPIHILLPSCLGVMLFPPSTQDSSFSIGVASLLLFLVSPTFSPVLPLFPLSTQAFSMRSQYRFPSHLRPSQLFSTSFVSPWSPSFFFLASVLFGFYLCLITCASIPRGLVMARLNGDCSVLISLGLL